MNNFNVKKETATTPNGILFSTANYFAVSIVVDAAVGTEVNGTKIAKAGTPLAGSLEERTTAFTSGSADGGTKGTWTCEITTAFAADEKIVINGVTYTKGSTQSATDKIFSGDTAAEQATSLVAIASDSRFTLTNSSGVITFTQKVADSAGTAPTVTKTATTGAIGEVTDGTPAVDGISNAVGVLLHDVDVTNGNNNATLLVTGEVNLERLEPDVAILITEEVKSALNKIVFAK